MTTLSFGWIDRHRRLVSRLVAVSFSLSTQSAKVAQYQPGPPVLSRADRKGPVVAAGASIGQEAYWFCILAKVDTPKPAGRKGV